MNNDKRFRYYRRVLGKTVRQSFIDSLAYAIVHTATLNNWTLASYVDVYCNIALLNSLSEGIPEREIYAKEERENYPRIGSSVWLWYLQASDKQWTRACNAAKKQAIMRLERMYYMSGK